MIPNETREKAYFEIDMLLSQLESGPVREAIVYQTTRRPINQPAHAHIMGEILKEYKLIETKPSQDFSGGMEKSITMNGIWALTAGGIREYMIDTNPAFVIHDNYPKVVTVAMKNGLYRSKHLINSSLEYADLMEHYENEDVHYNERTSHRSNGQILIQSERPAISSPPQVVNNYNNNFTGAPHILNQDSFMHNTGSIENNNQQTLGESKKRSPLEIVALVAAIIGAIAAVVVIFWHK